MTPYKANRGQTIATDIPRGRADRFFGAHLVFSAAKAVAASNVAVLAATALTSAAQSITAGITSPGLARALRIKGNAAGITGNVVAHGTNVLGETITETIALNGSTAVDGTKAFASVTKIDLPAETHTGTDTVSVGFCDKIGLPYLLARDTVMAAHLDNALEATHPTVAVSATAIESNTIKLSSALNGKQVDVYLLV